MWWLIFRSSLIFLPMPPSPKPLYSLVILAFFSLAAAAPASARTCEVALRLDSQVTLGALQLEIGYQAAPGSWLPGPLGVACATDAPNTLAPFVDDPATRVVTASFVSLTGIVGPRKLAHCSFVESGGTVEAQDFTIKVVDATTPDMQLPPKPLITVLLPDCSGDPVTTTTTSTTSTTSTTETSTTTSTTSTSTTSTTTTTDTTTSTTLPFCGNGVVDDEEQCDDGNTVPGDGCEEDCTAAVVCGDANGNDTVQSSDALLVLRKAIGQPVICPDSRCDADGDDVVKASDSLRVLKRAVGQSVVMACPPAA
jgi:cysteine-rich repeat protein